jgi:Cu/Zn superoxide dismutase
MKRLAYFTLGLLLALAALPSRSAAKTKVEVKDAQGKSVGDVFVWDQGRRRLELKLHDLTPDAHHFHVVQYRGPDFKSAGGHFNPSKSTGSIVLAAIMPGYEELHRWGGWQS